MSWNQPPRLRCGYDGATYVIWRGQEWCIRHHAPTTIRPECIEEQSRLVGCVFGQSGDTIHNFPPAELMEHCPGYVGAAYVPNGTTREVHTTCGVLEVQNCEWRFQSAPRQENTPLGLRAAAWREASERVGESA